MEKYYFNIQHRNQQKNSLKFVEVDVYYFLKALNVIG